jgi:hypothetical protein
LAAEAQLEHGEAFGLPFVQHLPVRLLVSLGRTEARPWGERAGVRVRGIEVAIAPCWRSGGAMIYEMLTAKLWLTIPQSLVEEAYVYMRNQHISPRAGD